MVERGDVQKKSNASTVMESNTIARNGAEGVGVGKLARSELRKNLIEDNAGAGLLVKGIVHVDGNQVMSNHKAGIELLETAEAEISNNQINRNEGHGIAAKAGA